MLRRVAESPHKIQFLYIFIALVVLTLIFFFLPLPERTFFWRAFQNSCHAPLFGLTAVVLVWFFHLVFERIRHWLHYLFALGVTAGIGMTTEIIQAFIGRDADLNDFYRDVVGAWSMLLLFALVDPFFNEEERAGVRRRATAFLMIAGVSLFGVFLPTLDWGIASLYRTAHLPVLCDFDSRWGRKFVFVNDAHKEFAPWPPAASSQPDDLALKLTFWSREYPTFALEECHPDWTAYDSLIFSIYSPLSDSTVIATRIHDSHHDERYADRFNGVLVVHPGVNRYALPLSHVKNGPADRELDMRHIASFKLFAHQPADSFALYIDSIYLR